MSDNSQSSIHAFMYKIIDYAGLFPPAQLDLYPALKNYAEYIRSADDWMMSKFIMPASRLDELTDELMSHFNQQFPLNLSLLTPFFDSDKSRLIQVQENYPASVICSGIESMVTDPDMFESRYEANRVARMDFENEIQAFYEMPRDADWSTEVKKNVQTLSDLNENYGLTDGFKLRCGGIEAALFPSPREISIAINICRDFEIPLKFTAGLHHPVRHYSSSVKTKMYGFFNIFIGGMLSYKHQLDNDNLEEIIIDEDARNFQFSDIGISWKNLELTHEDISILRSRSLISYGSCSFDEPREDLKELGLV